MTKYEELCSAYRKYSDDRIAYADRSRAFIANLVSDFISYLDAPTDRIRVYPPNVDDDDRNYTSVGAATPGEDGWWRIVVEVTLSRGANVFPELKARMLFQVRTEADRFLVRIGDSETIHVSTVGSQKEMQPIYNEAFNRSKEYLESGVERFLDETEIGGIRRIGFTSEKK